MNPLQGRHLIYTLGVQRRVPCWKIVKVCRTCAKRRQQDMGVEPKIGVFPPKWMVKLMENLIKMDDLGGTKTYFRKQPHGCIGSIVEFGWV